MPYIEESLIKFKNLPANIILTVDSDWISAELLKIENKYKLKLTSLVVFVVVGDILINDIEKYLQIEFGLESSIAKSVNNDLREKIFNPLLKRLNFINTHPQKSMTIKEEKDYLLKIFATGIIREFSENLIISEAVNARIFNMLSSNIKFKEEIEKTLYFNGEFLTHEEFELDNKSQSPTIGNWIQDFIKVYGSGMFNNLALTKYITESKNAKFLSQEEKLIVQKLLRLYRNIKFFPESMPSDDGEGWEIIPINKELDVEINKKIIGPPKTEEEKEIEELKQEEKQFSEGGLEQLAIEEEIESRKKLESLKIEANKYAVGSLERMAVEDEIKKLN